MCSLASGVAPAWVFDVLATGRATALKKGGNNVRLLVCHDPIRRLLTRALLAAEKEQISQLLGPFQFAVNKPGGCAAMAASARKLAEKYPDLVFFKLDLMNAYNSQPRSPALNKLGQHAPKLTSFLRLFYSRFRFCRKVPFKRFCFNIAVVRLKVMKRGVG